MRMIAEINNTPDYAEEYPYIVARPCETTLWFYGAYDTEARAKEVAFEVDGLVFYNER